MIYFDTISIEERLGVDALVVLIMNFDNDGIDEIICALYQSGSYTFAPNNLDLVQKYSTTPPSCPTTEKTLIIDLKALPYYLRYVFLVVKITLMVIIAADLINTKVKDLLLV